MPNVENPKLGGIIGIIEIVNKQDKIMNNYLLKPKEKRCSGWTKNKSEREMRFLKREGVASL